MAKILRDATGANLPIEKFPRDILKIIDDVLKGKNQIIVNYTLDEINELLKPSGVKIGKAALSNRIKQLNLNNKILRGRIPGVDYKPAAIGPKNEIVKNFVENINSKIAKGIQNENLSKIYKVDLGTDLAKALGKDVTSKQALSVFATYNNNRSKQPKLNLPALTDLAEARTNLGKDLTTKANRGVEYISKESILEKIGKGGTAWDTQKYGKLESLNDKGIKAAEQLFSNPAAKAEDLFNPLEKIAKLIRPGGSILAAKAGSGDRIRIESVAKAIKEKYPDYYALIKKLSNPSFKNRVLRDAKKDMVWSLEDVEMARRSGVNIASPSNIYDRLVNYAVRHYAQSKPGESLIQLFDENGKVITNVDDINSFKNITFKYRPDTSVDFKNIKNVYGTSRGLVDTPPKSTFVDLTFKGRDVPEFKEYFNKIDQIEDLRVKEVIHPVTKKPVKFSALMGETYKIGANYEDAFKRFPYEVDHRFGVAADPFKNLRVIPRRLNVAAGQASLWNPEYLKKMGYEFDKDPVRFLDDELKLADDVLRKGRRLRTAYAPAKEFVEKGRTVASQYVPSDEFLALFKKGTPKDQFKIATALNCVGGNADGGRIGYALGSGTIRCVETKLATETEIPKLTQLDDSSPGLTKMKNAATGFLGFIKKGGKYGAIAAAGAATAGLVKTFMNDDPTTYLSDENQQKNMLIEMVTGPMVDKPDSTPDILDWQLPVLGATAAAGTAVVAPSTIEASRSARFGKKPSGYTKTALKTLGRGLATTGTPLGLAAFEPLHIAGQVQAGDSLGEIATNPWNYAGLAFADDLSRFATKGLGPTAAKIMRLGISPAALKVGSRFLGLPGLALSLGISGYETYDDWKKKRGWFSEE